MSSINSFVEGLTPTQRNCLSIILQQRTGRRALRDRVSRQNELDAEASRIRTEQVLAERNPEPASSSGSGSKKQPAMPTSSATTSIGQTTVQGNINNLDDYAMESSERAVEVKQPPPPPHFPPPPPIPLPPPPVMTSFILRPPLPPPATPHPDDVELISVPKSDVPEAAVYSVSTSTESAGVAKTSAVHPMQKRMPRVERGPKALVENPRTRSRSRSILLTCRKLRQKRPSHQLF